MVRSLFSIPVLRSLVPAIALAFSPAAYAGSRSAEITGVVNINTATADELRMLPGIGAKKAQRILDQRAKHKFDSTDQLMKVKGIGRATYRKLKPNLAVTGANTIARGEKRTTSENAAPEEKEKHEPEGKKTSKI